MSFNKCIMIGNLTRDCDLRYTASGTAVCNMSIAVNTKYKSGDEYKENVCYVDVVVWGKQGESCAQYLSKGRQVLVEGRLDLKTWESDGQKRRKHEIVASTVRFLGNKNDGQSDQSNDQGHGEVSEIEPF